MRSSKATSSEDVSPVAVVAGAEAWRVGGVADSPSGACSESAPPVASKHAYRTVATQTRTAGSQDSEVRPIPGKGRRFPSVVVAGRKVDRFFLGSRQPCAITDRTLRLLPVIIPGRLQVLNPI
jgi:hypothetical protein